MTHNIWLIWLILNSFLCYAWIRFFNFFIFTPDNDCPSRHSNWRYPITIWLSITKMIRRWVIGTRWRWFRSRLRWSNSTLPRLIVFFFSQVKIRSFEVNDQIRFRWLKIKYFWDTDDSSVTSHEIYWSKPTYEISRSFEVIFDSFWSFKVIRAKTSIYENPRNSAYI